MNPLRMLVRLISSWSLAPLIARGVALLGAIVVLAHIGKGALGHLDEVAVTPVYASIRQSAAPHQARDVPPGQPSPDARNTHVAHGLGDVAHGPRDAAPGPGDTAHAPGDRSAKPNASVKAHRAPAAGDEPSQACSTSEGPGCSGSRAPGVTADGRIILNTATVTDLVRLPGVGKSRATAILALRKKLGRFRRIRDLLRVRGIGFKSLKKLKPLVVLDPPQEPDAKAGKK